jgi:hypothetical protein
MAAAGIAGSHAMPRGLRHSFGMNGLLVPQQLVQRWRACLAAHHLDL